MNAEKLMKYSTALKDLKTLADDIREHGILPVNGTNLVKVMDAAAKELELSLHSNFELLRAMMQSQLEKVVEEAFGPQRTSTAQVVALSKDTYLAFCRLELLPDQDKASRKLKLDAVRKVNAAMGIEKVAQLDDDPNMVTKHIRDVDAALPGWAVALAKFVEKVGVL